jgi:phage tail sheath protein FI
MAVTPALSYPGVYVQEVPSGVRTIVGVGTSIGMFIGASKRGPINRPQRCLNYAAFREKFGEDSSAGQLAQYIRLFFLNGGTDCYVLRIANGASASSVTLRNERNTADALILTAKDQGLDGESVRAIVTYAGALPEATFNVELYAWALQSGQRVKTRREVWKNLSMDAASSSFAPTFLTQNSKLVNATLPGVLAPLIQGISQSGRPVPHTGAGGTFRTAWAALVGTAVTARNRFRISVDGSPFIEVDLNHPTFPPLNVGAMPVATIQADLANEIRNRIISRFSANGIPGLTLHVAFIPGPPPSPTFIGPPVPNQTTLLQISSLNNGDIYIRPAGVSDLAVPLMLGAEQGGLEIAAHAPRRPAPSGISLMTSTATPLGPPPSGWNTSVWLALASLTQNAFTPAPPNGMTLEEFLPPPAVGTVAHLVQFNDLITTTGADLFYRDNNAGSPNDNNDGVRDKLRRMADAINLEASNNSLFRWTASVAGTRLTILPTEVVEDNFLSAVFNVTGFAVANFLNNVKVYTLGAGGFNIGARQFAGTTGSDGTPPLTADYDAAYEITDREVDLFNLMILPPVANPAVPIESVYGNASNFCLRRRAFLLMDSPASWADPQTATAGLTALRIGLVKDYSAVFYPRITIDEQGLKQNIGPAGALAGLFARIDSTRGVWKAPAGTEADLRGIVGLEKRLSDGENGILNPRAINTLRIFPSGIVNWGARTNQGDDDTPHDYKYIPIRRLALFMEESLYRGLKWVVFEPNDEPLWAQIRLNVGAFMHNLFRQGAFQGRTPKDAYFVKCDGETTTQNDRNLGIVNIWVGFAPLKPAEFVILYLQQMAGQIET